MATDNPSTPEISIPWAGKKVTVADVEEELAFLWHLSADNVRIGQNMNVRTGVLNFVICAPDIEAAQRASALIRELSSTHIARVLLVVLDATAPSGILTWVTLRSFPVISDLMRHSFEQVTIVITGAALSAAGNTVQLLIKPDLPAYFWWVGDPPQDAALWDRLQSISDRIIVDSHHFLSTERSLSLLSELLHVSPDCALSDLNWGRITTWRNLIAQFFDIAEFKSHLSSVSQIEIEHAVAPLAEPGFTSEGDLSPNPVRALLLAGWLKASLSWRLTENSVFNEHDSDGGAHLWHLARSTGPLKMQTPGAQVGRTTRLGSSGEATIVIRPRVQPHVRPGSLCLVRLSSMLENKQTSFTIEREDDTADYVITTIEVDGETRLRRAVALPVEHQEPELLHTELEITGRDRLYEETIHAVSELLTEQT